MSDGRVRTSLPTWVPERSTPQLTFTLRDADNAIVTNPTSVTMTIVTAVGKPVREETDITSRIAAGAATIVLSVDDTRIVAPRVKGKAVSTEVHVAHIHWTWDGGARHGRHDIEFTVYNSLVPV